METKKQRRILYYQRLQNKKIIPINELDNNKIKNKLKKNPINKPINKLKNILEIFCNMS